MMFRVFRRSAQRQELYPESAGRMACADEKRREAGAIVATAGNQDFGWSQVGLSRRRSRGC